MNLTHIAAIVPPKRRGNLISVPLAYKTRGTEMRLPTPNT